MLILNTSILVNGNWTEWSAWSKCSETCGGGVMNRNRSCTDPEPQYGGLDCSGNRTDHEECNTHACPSKK